MKKAKSKTARYSQKYFFQINCFGSAHYLLISLEYADDLPQTLLPAQPGLVKNVSLIHIADLSMQWWGIKPLKDQVRDHLG